MNKALALGAIAPLFLMACNNQSGPTSKQPVPEARTADGGQRDSLDESIVLASQSQLGGSPIAQAAPTPQATTPPPPPPEPKNPAGGGTIASTPEPQQTGVSTAQPVATQPLFTGQLRVICPGYPVGRRGVAFYQQIGDAPVWIPCESGDKTIQEVRTIVQAQQPQQIQYANGVSFLAVQYGGQSGFINMMSLTPIDDGWKKAIAFDVIKGGD